MTKRERSLLASYLVVVALSLAVFENYLGNWEKCQAEDGSAISACQVYVTSSEVRRYKDFSKISAARLGPMARKNEASFGPWALLISKL